ncbi:(Fe-S)-binding protein [Thermodesulforhabdus norvegica]|uniref:Fe-S oxidoreductase n=1 Tax=Thermodesulforhabdus norvegica TaxID=39841 RepID=A0A1I4QJX0_9BACT|nr:(Fe-S)-binding protein [Thermodesulforhabdus norvegica]SFM40422.1 Fe-S oxidoreductase [Thermodesulforhabdus norvegica]
MTGEGIRINPSVIKEILDQNNGARIRTWLSICSRCGLCAESCFFYLANNKDLRFSPAYKFHRTLGTLYKKKGKVDEKFLQECLDIAWGECTTCKRCSMYCPFGIDIASMISLVRTICYSQGFVPEGLARTLPNYRQFGNQMAVTAEDLVETCEWMAEEARDEIKGVEIPIDLAGARYMYTINPREVMFYPQDLAMAAQIFRVAGESWTIPTSGWDCTNLAMYAGDKKLAGEVVEAMYKKARELGVEAILITECGHAFRSAAFEGPYLAGYRNGKPPVPVKHSVELFYEYLRDGKIKIDPAKKIDVPITYQDPCNVSRNGGLWEQGREIMRYIAEDFRDMSPNRDHNHCCGGGGGFIPMGGPFRKRRMISGRVKAEQIRATGAKIVVTPCHNCYDQINDLNKEYNLGVRVVSLKELIVETMFVPEELRPDEQQREESSSDEV